MLFRKTPLFCVWDYPSTNTQRPCGSTRMLWSIVGSCVVYLSLPPLRVVWYSDVFHWFFFVSYWAPTVYVLCIGDAVKSTQCAEAFTIKFYGSHEITVQAYVWKISFWVSKRSSGICFLLNKNINKNPPCQPNLFLKKWHEKQFNFFWGLRYDCNICLYESNLSQCMRFPTMWYVRPSKPQISLRIRAVWSEPLLVAWLFCDC